MKPTDEQMKLVNALRALAKAQGTIRVSSGALDLRGSHEDE